MNQTNFKFIRSLAVAAALSLGLAACGGGGSSSGGGMEVAMGPELPLGKFTGSYQTEAYSGSISVTIDGPVGVDIINGSTNVIIEMTGVPCLPRQFSSGMTAQVSNNRLFIGGDIGGVPASNIGGAPNILINVPVEGGTGTIESLNPSAPCVSQASGTITLVR